MNFAGSWVVLELATGLVDHVANKIKIVPLSWKTFVFFDQDESKTHEIKYLNHIH